MVAIGSLHESLKQNTWTRNAPTFKPHEPFALQQCNKAIGLLVAADATAPRSALMLTCSIFFMAFDMIQNKVDSALLHLQHAWSILAAWRSEKSSSATFSEIDLIQEHLLPIIARFSASFSPSSPQSAALFSAVVEQVNERTRKVQTMPQSFVSLNQVQSSLHHILDGLCLSLPTEDTAQVKVIPSSKEPALSMLALWKERYQQFIDSLDSRDLHPATRRRLTLIEIHYTTARLLYEMQSTKDEMVYDTHLQTFQNILQQCETVAKIEREITASSEPKMAVCFDLGIIMPLYFIASRCRHPGVRREALRLLIRFPRREGIWLSWVTGMVAQQVIDIEEHGLRNPQFCEDVPLENRIEMVEMHYNPCPLKDVTGEECYAPVIQLTWTSAQGNQDAPRKYKDIRRKSIQLPKTLDDRPGQHQYWVTIPEGGQLSSPKLLLGKKTFVAPPTLLPENFESIASATNVTGYPTPLTLVPSRTSESSATSRDALNSI